MKLRFFSGVIGKKVFYLEYEYTECKRNMNIKHMFLTLGTLKITSYL